VRPPDRAPGPAGRAPAPAGRSYRRGLTPLAPALGRVRDDLAPQTLLAEAQRVWPEAVGPAIAAEAQPSAERGGVLTVSCSASVWAQELDLMAPVILEQLNARLRRGRIERLRCVSVPPRVQR
jgi:predicted nucleic acid-binding Zn ribbon protein